jgi:hypothetical protein
MTTCCVLLQVEIEYCGCHDNKRHTVFTHHVKLVCDRLNTHITSWHMYHIHKNLTVVPVLRQLNQLHIRTPYLRSILILST